MKTVTAPTLEGFFASTQFEIYGIAMAAILVLVIVNYAIDAFMKH